MVLPHAEPHVLHDQKWEDLLNLDAGEIRRRIWNHENSSFAVMGKLSFKEFMIWIGQELDLTDDQLTDWNEDQWSLVRYDQDLANWLQSLRSRFKVAFVSNAWSDAREELSARYGLAEQADLMVFSAEERVAKPQLGIYEVTLERLGVTAPESIFVDDQQENVDAAISLGMAGIVCTSPEQMMRDANSVLGSNTLDLVARMARLSLGGTVTSGSGIECRNITDGRGPVLNLIGVFTEDGGSTYRWQEESYRLEGANLRRVGGDAGTLGPTAEEDPEFRRFYEFRC